MTVLVLTSSISAADARWIDLLHEQGEEIEVYDVTHAKWVRRLADHPAKDVPTWLDMPPLRRQGNALSTFYQRLVQGRDYRSVVTLGVPAGGVAARHGGAPFHPVLFSGDLDFSAARRTLGEDMHDLTRSSPVLFLEDSWEFDKALSKDSRSAHVLHPGLQLRDRSPILEPATAAPQVLLLHPEGMSPGRVEALQSLFEPVVRAAGGQWSSRSISSLYRHRDAQRGRALVGTMRTRLAGATHVVAVGWSRDHRPVLETLLDSGAGGRLFVEDTVSAGLWAEHLHSRQLVQPLDRATGLAASLEQLLQGLTPAWPAADPSAAQDHTAPDLVEALAVKVKTLPRADYEELGLEAQETAGPSDPVDAFFSTSPLEDRVSGARPQRVRQTEQALRTRRDTVRLPSYPHSFRRRAALLRRLLEQGRPAGFLYGENSTSPMAFDETMEELASLMADFRRHGGVSGWFVRDLHWLDQQGADFVDQPEHHQTLVRRGLAELNIVGGQADVLYAPSRASAEGFAGLLSGHSSPDTPWAPLPPAVSLAHAVRPRPSAFGDPVTLLYAGGLGSFYTMTSYLKAVAALEIPSLSVDFVVRAAEAHRLEELLATQGLQDDPRVTISTEDFDVYVPRPGLTIGTVLLDSDYARFAFPFKTVSFLERGFPVLTYRDMSLAEFVEAEGLGMVCDRDPADTARVIEQMASTDWREPLTRAQRRNSWGERMRQAQSAAEAAARS